MNEETITLTERDLPYIIAEPDVPVTSMIKIAYESQSEEFYGDERVLFYLANAELQVTSGYGGERSFIKVHHSFGRDVEGDRAYIAYFDLTSVQFISSYDQTLNFRGWLTADPKFYPDETPFDGEEREPEYEEGEEWDGYRNSGYPYLPPSVKIPGVKTPMPVEITVNFGHTPEQMADWVKRIREGKEKRKVERIEKARLAAEEAERRKAERQRERERLDYYLDNEPNGEELRTLAAELQSVRGEEKEAFFDDGKYTRLQELRAEFYDWADKQNGLVPDERS